MRIRKAGWVGVGLTVATLCSNALATAPFQLANDARIDPNQFRVTTFASGLPYTTAMQRLSDGSLLVAVNDPTGGKYYASTGKLLRLTDTNNDGVADDAGTYLNTNLPGSIVQMRQAGELLIVNSVAAAGTSINFFRRGATPTSLYTSIGSINFTLPANQTHRSYALAVRPGGAANQYEVFFNLGSRFNASNDSATVALTGMISTAISPESIYRMTVTDNGGANVAIANMQRIASGLRNAAGIAFHPVTGDLYFQDNGIDGLVDPNEPLSVDELNMIPAAQIGASVPNFGFATDYIQYRTGTRVGSGAVQPIQTFQPIPSPNGSESEGAAEITFAPPNFPAALNTGIFVGFHGKFNDYGIVNEENPMRYVDLAGNTSFEFIDNNVPTIGHMDNVLATDDSLFIADINSLGSMINATPSGAIYQVTAIPEPAMTWAGFALAATLSRPRRKKCSTTVWR
jgi:glucose/arabinose dehydrogenase